MIIQYTPEKDSALKLFLEECFSALGNEIDYSGTESDLADIESSFRADGGNFWIYLLQDEIIGSIGFRKIEAGQLVYGELRRFYVRKDLQNQGYGTKLLKRLLQNALEQGCDAVRLCTSHTSRKAIRLYQKFGFRQIPQYRKSNGDFFMEYSIRELETKENPDFSSVCKHLRESLERQEADFDKTLILNPVENVPLTKILSPSASFLHGLYNTDSIRTDEQKTASKIQFSGRNQISLDINEIYAMWAKLLKADRLSMRLLSGLHAHIIIFMALSDIGDKVLLLPEAAGGHMATRAILERLGLRVEEFIVDPMNTRIDKEKSKELIETFQPDFIFVDRSEGLIFEDFSWVCNYPQIYKIFDASQYLTNIIAGDYPNPLIYGFDLLLSTLHKNLPGPQRALVCCRHENRLWDRLKAGISKYVSNMHVFSIYSAGLLLDEFDTLQALSSNMLINAQTLEEALAQKGIPVVKRMTTPLEPATHHLWLPAPERETAFQWYLALEQTGLLVNYRLLPYGLGYGLRLGLSAATYGGLMPPMISDLSDLLADTLTQGYSDNLRARTEHFICRVKGHLPQ